MKAWKRTLAVRALFVTLAISVFSVALVAQKTTTTEKPKNPLVGRWKSDEAVIDIRADGSITINDAEYVYKVKNGGITVSSDQGSLAFPYALEGDTLTVEFEGREIVYTRLKSKGLGVGSGTGISGGEGTTGREGVLPALVGKWCYTRNLTGTNSYASSRCFVLNANGTYEYAGESS